MPDLPPWLHKVSVLVLVPLVAQLHYGGWYGLRAGLYAHLTQLGFTSEEVSAVYQSGWLLHVVGLVLGGLLGAAIGPRWLLVLGTLGSALATVAAALAPVGLFAIANAALAAAHGMVAAGVVASAVVAFPGAHAEARLAVVLLVYGAINAGALVMPWVTTALAERFGWPLAFGALGALGALSSLLALVAAIVPAREGPLPRWERALAVDLGLLFVLAAPFALANHAMNQQWALLSALPTGQEALSRLNTVGVILLVLALAPITGALQLARLRLPVLLPLALGLLLHTVVISVSAVAPSGSYLVVTAAIVLWTLAEVLTGPTVLSRVGADVHWRAATPLVAAWMAATWLGLLVLDRVAAPDYASGNGELSPWFLVVAAVSCGITALVAAVAAVPVHRWLAPPPPPEPEAGAP